METQLTINGSDDYVTYKQAINLQDCGFDWPTDYYYSYDTKKRFNAMFCNNQDVPAPTLAQAAKWLREVKDIYIDVDQEKVYKNRISAELAGEWCFELWIGKDKHITLDEILENGMQIWYSSYEKALSAGITKAINYI